MFRVDADFTWCIEMFKWMCIRYIYFHCVLPSFVTTLYLPKFAYVTYLNFVCRMSLFPCPFSTINFIRLD